MVKVVCGKSRIGEASYRGEGMGQIVVGEIELGGASWTHLIHAHRLIAIELRAATNDD